MARETASVEAGIRSSQAYLREHGVDVGVSERRCRDCSGWTASPLDVVAPSEPDGVSKCSFCGSANLDPAVHDVRKVLP